MVLILATATQQETDSEVSSETLNKTSQPGSSAQPAPTETTSAPKEKEAAVEKSKESVTVSMSSFGASFKVYFQSCTKQYMFFYFILLRAGEIP